MSPEMEGTRKADVQDLILIIFIFVLRLALIPTTLYTSFIVQTTRFIIQLAGSPLTITIAIFNLEASNFSWLVNFFRWILIDSIYIGYVLLQLLQLPFQVLNALYAAIMFWPKFYLQLFGPSSEGRSILSILCNPTGEVISSKAARERFDRDQQRSNCYISLRPTHARCNVFTSLQVDGANSYLASPLNKQVKEGLIAAADTAILIPYFDDPFKLSIPYAYLAQRITEPPDCLLQYLWAMGWHFFWAFCYIFRGCCVLRKYRLDDAYLSGLFCNDVHESTSSENNMRVHCFATGSESNTSAKDIISFDTDGIPFIVDSGADCIISHVRDLFEDLTPVEVTIATANGTEVRTRYTGTFNLQLPDDSGTIHSYKIPDTVYDPYTHYNILGIAKLSKFFGDSASSNDPWDKDGTRAESGGTRTHLLWDHGQHELHFLHPTDGPGLPILHLYKGTTIFKTFFSHVSRFYDGAVHFAFSSAYSVAPLQDATENEGDRQPDDDEREWYDPSICHECSPKQKEKCSFKFELGESLLYTKIQKKKKKNKKMKTSVQAISVVYEGVNADGTTHIVRLKDGLKMAVPAAQEAYLQKHLQPSFDNIPQTPLDYKHEVGTGVTQEEAQQLARPNTLSPAQQELLSWHHRLYHLKFKRIFTLARLGFLPKTLLECESTVPLCIECQFGQAHRRPWTSKGKKYRPIQKKSETKPGDGVSVDQIVSAQPGLIPQMSGFLTHERIWGATTFVDHVSDYVYVHLMKTFTIEETLSAKKAFEKIVGMSGNDVKSYRADNGRFADTKWQQSCETLNQELTLCGVGNHRQNGKIEAKNKQLTLAARTLLLHGMRMWPEMISTYFWPFAMKAAAECHNRLTVDVDGNTPESRLYGSMPESYPVKAFHTLFCPVFVLDHRLHSAGGSIPKWEPRSRCGVYLGHSPLHAGNVALVFNPITGRVSPAYHVVFDDTFSTVPYMKAASLPPNWEDLVKNSTEIATDEAYELADDFTKELENGNSEQLERKTDPSPTRITDPFAIVPDQNSQDSEFSLVRESSSVGTPLVQPSEGEKSSQTSSKRVSFDKDMNVAGCSSSNKRTKLNDGTSTGPSQESSVVNAQQQAADPLSMPPIINLEEAGLRRSARIAAAKESQDKKTADGVTVFGVSLFTALGTVGSITVPNHRSITDENQNKSSTWTDRCMTKFHEVNELYDGTLNRLHFMSLTTLDGSSNEVFTYRQAMNLDDREDFLDAMEKEIADHTKRGHWIIVPRSSMPTGKKAIMSIWSMKRKRLPDGTLLKHKARLCAHGGMQQWGENYWETYSPVVNMLTVRLLLIICKIHKLHSKSIDFVLAFPQADLEEDIWMQIPQGVTVESEDGEPRLLKLCKNLYGLKQGSNNWFKHLKKGLMTRGLKPSDIDPCLYLKEGLAVLTYVDDCILVSSDQKAIDELVDSLENGEEKFLLTDEGDIDKFLGIEINHFEDGSFEITQPHLTSRILQLLGLDRNNEWKSSTKSRLLPSEQIILHRDSEGEQRKYTDKWNYRTAVGMLTYLQGNTRPDISVHVHQCARFSIDPKRSHERAIIRIGRYLLTSRERGIIYKPDTSKGLECYVDADFAGSWQKADAESADSVMSRTGYVLMYAGCPIHWVSKLQTEIALSTAEAEYIAL